MNHSEIDILKRALKREKLARKNAEKILEEMRNEGKMIQQETSYVAGNNVFCVYNADSEELIKEHAERSGGVATEITEVTTVINHNTSVVS